MPDGTRPNFEADYVLHGAMKKFANIYGIDTGEAYIIGAQLLVNLEPSIDYNPSGSDVLATMLEKCGNKDTENNG